jgi:hypothetical protein
MEKQKLKLSLSPLSFDEAVTDIMKIKPEPKTLKAKRKAVSKSRKFKT